ncbi:hypothetical protein [Allostreptomyces psammosilenae]|uniref:Uncharacterized protein n=1 Tax=Allostreptomyces psammosilenae TaxID=1892865 RepID=A0A852ZQQ1_9ACTN|nr:hypothetical protein [Allostreptomyces psammosilenae]NYI04709.1 hypothetical protein [Allostreptomyces psammosilenae]
MGLQQRRAGEAGRLFPRTVVAVGCLSLAVAANWSGLLLVVAEHVVPHWALGLVLLSVSLLLLRTPAARGLSVTDEAVLRGRPSRLFIAVLAAAAGLGSACGALGDLTADYHVLEPKGPGGCRAVVRESSFLFSGSGEVYVVGASEVGWHATSSWMADDGYTPIAFGAYELSWDVQGGVLSINTMSGDPVWPSVHTLTCR